MCDVHACVQDVSVFRPQCLPYKEGSEFKTKFLYNVAKTLLVRVSEYNAVHCALELSKVSPGLPTEELFPAHGGVGGGGEER